MDRPQYDVPIPKRLAGRPRDSRGFIVPYFVAWLDDDGNKVKEQAGKPDFRVIDTDRFYRCIMSRECWLCGKRLGRFMSFVIGPMCAITRTTAEPPSHLECARYACQVCPFLARPAMRRNAKDLPPQKIAPAGIHLDRNPGVMSLWTSRSYKTFKAQGGNSGLLIQVGDPEHVEWWHLGRHATRAEVQASIDSGLPALREIADKHDGPSGREELERKFIPTVQDYLPRAP
jgi:hypothetical protein